MKNTNKNSLSISSVCLILLTVLFAFSQAHAQAQTITYKGDVKLPPPLGNRPIQLMNDSGLGATDLDVPNDPNDPGSTYTKSRNLVLVDRV